MAVTLNAEILFWKIQISAHSFDVKKGIGDGFGSEEYPSQASDGKSNKYV